MNLEKLEIQNFRGVRDSYSFKPEGNNAIIVGPNGSGKSSILEALDFLLKDELTHLDLDGIRRSTKNQVIANIGADGPCIVEGHFSIDDGEIERLVRDAETRELDPPQTEVSEELKQLIQIAEQGQHILTRSELLDLIIAQPSSRRGVLTRLLNLPDVDERRLILKRTRDKIGDELDDAKAARKSRLNRLSDLCDIDQKGEVELQTEILDELNKLREQFDGDAVDEINLETIREDLKSPLDKITTEALHRPQPQRELKEAAAWAEEATDKVFKLVGEIGGELDELQADKLGNFTPKRLELLEVGLEVVEPDAERCPLCDQAWDETDPLHDSIKHRYENYQEQKRLQNSIGENKNELRSLLRDGTDHLRYLTTELSSETYPEARSLNLAVEDLEETIEILKGELVEEVEAFPESLPIIEDTEELQSESLADLKKELTSLLGKIPEEASLSKEETSYEKIQTIADQWKEYNKFDQRGSEFRSLESDVDNALSAFIAARKDVMGSIYGEIESRVDAYYGKIHPDESEAILKEISNWKYVAD